MRKSTTVVGIAGASGAGKSQFAQELFSRLSTNPTPVDVRIIHEDSYYRDQSELEFADRERTNYDHPDAFEHELLVQHLAELKAGRTAQVPQYDYAVHNRRTERLSLPASDVLIVEGILVLHDPRVRENLDIMVFVDVPLDICLSRRIRRDTQQRDRSVLSILNQFETTVRPMYFRFVEPTRDYADIIVPRGGENETALQMLLDHVLALDRKS